MLRLLICCQLKSGGYGLVRGAHLLPPIGGGGELLVGYESSGLGGHGEGLRRSRGDAAGVEPGA